MIAGFAEADVLGAVLLAGVITYAVLGGADFGGGVWDLFARGPRAREQRAAIAHAMGPVWEANHVWLIFVITLLFTGFPPAFAALSLALFVPWHLVLLGIVLRGAAFVFRSPTPPTGAWARPWDVVFGAASLVTPFVLGTTLGAISSGALRVGERGIVDAGGVPAWLSPPALGVGLLAVAVCAFLAAVYLTLETEGDLREDFRRRALAAWAAVAGLAVLLLPLLAATTPRLFPGFLDPRAAPVLLGGATFAGASLWGLLTRRFRLARAAAVAEVVTLLAGWGALLQFPYLIYPDLTLREAAAPATTLRFVLAVVAVGTLVVVPSIALLFRVFKGGSVGPSN